jgi:hypothetical protein
VLKKKFITVLLLTLVITTKAQPTLDTIKDCLKQKPQLFAKLDGRNSFIENSRARIFGFKLGVSYGKRVHFGLGYNQLFPNSDAFDKKIYVFNFSELFPINANLHMYYISAHAEYTFYTTKHWELSMPLQFGVGKSYYTYDFLGARFRTEQAFNFIYEPAISIEYKIVKWVGVGADLGYRFMVTRDKHLNSNFTSPTYAFKLLIYYGEIFKSLFPKSKLAGKL